MNGAADMGGMHGFGSVEIEPNEPVFHADWEKKAFALNMAIGVANIWNLDAFRFARESLPPPQYLNTSYYGLWVVTLETMMLKYGIATDEELKAGHALAPDEESGTSRLLRRRWQTWFAAARPMVAQHRPPQNSRRATRCARAMSIRKRTRACRATRAGIQAR
jgi:nitrile hydratase